MKAQNVFREFFNSEKAGGVVLVACVVISLIIANSPAGNSYHHLLQFVPDVSFLQLKHNLSIENWVNDGLMAIFFLLVGLEIKRELYIGELSTLKSALLPVIAATGGMIFPALIHFCFNAGTNAQAGFGIPMATDIAFALGILSLAGNRIPVALKVFLTAFAIIDDLGAISVIAIFYTHEISFVYLCTALGIALLLFIAGKKNINHWLLYLVGGVVLWYCMLQSGVHATIAGVLLAFALPFHAKDKRTLSNRLQHGLHKPVAFIILPLFALSNTAIIFPSSLASAFGNGNAAGIIAGLVAGKFIGIFFICWLAVKMKLASLAVDISWKQLCGVSLLGGIGFTMSIFITNLAFTDQELITNSKISILFASFIAALAGLLVLRLPVARRR